MSLDAGLKEPQFVHPGEAAPIGYRLGHTEELPAAAFAATSLRGVRARQASAVRRNSRIRRLLPFVVAVAAAAVFVALTEGGRHARRAAPFAFYFGQVLEKVGLGLSEVTVRGQRMTRDDEIYDKLQLSARRSIWLLDTEAARRRVETLPWVLKASVKRVFPDRLYIEVSERSPRAIWNDGHQTTLLDATGRVLGTADAKKYSTLPTIFGVGAAKHANSIIETVNRVPALRGRVGLYEWTANRRWTLHLKSGRQILLPAAGVSSALLQLTKGKHGQRLLDRNFERLDLRLKSQVAIEFRE